jgi:S1-C subfamily serine protease
MAVISSLRPIPAGRRPIAVLSKLRPDLATILFLVLGVTVISTSAGAQTYQPNSAYLGITFQTIDKKNARRVSLSRASGCINTKSKANAAGEKGDKVVRIESRDMIEVGDATAALDGASLGATVMVEIERDGHAMSMPVRHDIGKAPGASAQ